MRFVLVAATLLVALPAVAPAQEDMAEAPRPDGWQVRTDRAQQDPAQVNFMDMPPGWHVTTGPAAILWHPERTASGEFHVEMESFLFDPRGRREAFGFFVGGRDLESDAQAYVYFLLREGGEFLIKRRSGAETDVIVDWSAAPSMVSWAAKPEDAHTARNVIAVEAGSATVRFLVNGEEVASLPRASLPLDGVVGLRVNHGLNLHVSRLDVRQGGRP